MLGTTQYFCQNEARRELARAHPSINGIDYLEVLDSDAPAEEMRQRTLLVYCFKPLPTLGVGNVHIEGGVRVTAVKALWVARADQLPAVPPPPPALPTYPAPLTTAERDYLAALPNPERVLVVRTDANGDYSVYRLRLITAPTDPSPPDNFDQQLAVIDFSFKVECPTDFDCAPAPECPPEPGDEPVIDYLAKDYASFRRLILDRLSVIMPDWQERNPADLGIALVELLAYAGDYLSYYQDAVASEAYLGTARRRTSVRRHARLLDYRMHDGCNARAWVAFTVDPTADGLCLPGPQPFGVALDEWQAGRAVPCQPFATAWQAGTRLLTRVEGLDATALTTEAQRQQAAAANPLVFETMHDLVLYSAHNQINFYTWGDRDCCLPKGATRATLYNDAASPLRLHPGDVLILAERRSPDTGVVADADISHRHAVRLTKVQTLATTDVNGQPTPFPGQLLTDRLTGQPIVEVEWHPADALPFPFCLSAVIEGREYQDMGVAYGNVALADHGATIDAPKNLALIPRAEGIRYNQPLPEPGLSFVVPYRDAEARSQPAMQRLAQDARAALAAVRLAIEAADWQVQPDLLASSQFDEHFVVEAEGDGYARLRFGDDVMGSQPLAGALAEVSYRLGNGPAGNVGVGAIHHIITTQTGINAVFNPLPASGGTAPESLTQVRLYALQAFRTQERAVTIDDYATIAGRHPEVQRAQARIRWTGSWYTVFVTIDRRGGRSVDAAFRAEIADFLDCYRMAGYDLEVEAPLFVPLDIAFTVCVAPGYVPDQVKARLLEVFSSRVRPDGSLGFFHPDNFTFGQPVYLSQVVAAAMRVPGMQWVDFDDDSGKPNRFRRWGQPAHGEIAAGRIPIATLEIARLDNDRNQPENGDIEFIMQLEILTDYG